MDEWWDGFPRVTWAIIALLFPHAEYPTVVNVAAADHCENEIKNRVAHELAKHRHHR